MTCTHSHLSSELPFCLKTECSCVLEVYDNTKNYFHDKGVNVLPNCFVYVYFATYLCDKESLGWFFKRMCDSSPSFTTATVPVFGILLLNFSSLSQ